LNDIQDVREPTELGDAMRELNEDIVDEESKQSSIDMRTRLNKYEIPTLSAVDMLVSFKMIPEECLSLTRQLKRLRVSLNGEGRKELVSVVHGQREHKEASRGLLSGMGESIKGFFGGS